MSTEERSTSLGVDQEVGLRPSQQQEPEPAHTTEYPFLPGESWEGFQETVRAEFDLSRQLAEFWRAVREREKNQ